MILPFLEASLVIFALGCCHRVGSHRPVGTQRRLPPSPPFRPRSGSPALSIGGTHIRRSLGRCVRGRIGKDGEATSIGVYRPYFPFGAGSNEHNNFLVRSGSVSSGITIDGEAEGDNELEDLSEVDELTEILLVASCAEGCQK
mmetsp:Transcript_34102/g.62784  ORF Transcript_34102/g.62784 Transcript_34102/m.62784 type:complete len:143 (-) Transcript_34102:1340-1768(-)